MDIFLEKRTDSLQEAFIHPLKGFIWLHLDCWTKTPTYSHSNTWKSQDIFNLTPISFIWKMKVSFEGE